jgi:hypothetical protein
VSYSTSIIDCNTTSHLCRINATEPAKLTWSEADIAEYLKSGFTPKFDTAGGHMVAVIENTAKLSPSDRQAIAVYLKTVLGLRE